jgi:carboxyl-terminal processing protease
MKKQLFRIIPFLFILFIIGCKNDDNKSADVNREIYKIFQDIYLWYDQLPQIDPENYSNPYEFIQALRYKPLDKWSFAMPRDEYNAYFVQGEMVGHGFVLSSDEDNNVRIALIYPSTQAYQKGVRRGWIVNRINGSVVTNTNISGLIGKSEAGINNRIEFITHEGATVEISLTKEVIQLNPVVYSSVIDFGGKRVGYLVFQDFIAVANREIDSIFNFFKQEGINDLIVDLRYNGGGSVDVAVYLSSWLTGNENANRNLVNFQHNNKNTDLDTSYNIPLNTGSLDLDKIVFIGTRGTASASELIINGMEPFMDVTLVGTPTDGKPVGMYALVFRNYNYAVFPVSFKYTNALGEGDFYEGLNPDILANDDVTKDFGDPNEGMLGTALNFITGGGITAKKTTAGSVMIKPPASGSEFLRAF